MTAPRPRRRSAGTPARPTALPGHVVDRYGRQLRLPHGPPYVQRHGVCMRCESSPIVIVPNDDPKSVGLSAWVALCAKMCRRRRWTCPKCDGRKVPEHTKWCEVAHPGYRKRWLESRRSFAGQMLKLATMIALREERLPRFLMRMLFNQPGRK